MARDTLQTLMRLRQAALDEARQALAQAIAGEEAAAGLAVAADRAMLDEQDAAMAPGADDHAVEAFAAWLPRGRAAAAAARAGVEQAQARVVHARAVVSAAQAGAETVEMLVAKRATAALKDVARREQDEADEAAGRLPPGDE